MSSKESSDPKQRIFDASVRLFACKGYEGVGVREIARDADVNISMISYYYGGKPGLLKVIIERFFENYIRIFDEAFSMELSREKVAERLVKDLVLFIKSDPNLCKVAFLEFPYDLPEITELKAKKIQILKELIGDRFASLMGVRDEDFLLRGIIGPAFICMVFSHFLIGDVVKDVVGYQYNNAFYEHYADVIANLFNNGVGGFALENNQ